MFIVFVSLTVLGYSVSAHAEELSEEESPIDSEQNERLNSLEIRLEELGYRINEIEGVLEEIQTSELLEEQERLAVSEKLDLVIIGLNDLINYDIEKLEKADNSELLTDVYRNQVLEALNCNADSMEQLNATTLRLSDDTVSGNILITNFSDSISTDMQNISETSINEFNETLLKTNTLLSYLFWLLLFVLVLIICFWLGTVLKNIIRHIF